MIALLAGPIFPVPLSFQGRPFLLIDRLMIPLYVGGLP